MNCCPNCRDGLRRTEPPGYWRCRGCGTVISDRALRDVVWPISPIRQRVIRALVDVHHDGYPTEDLADAALAALGLDDFEAAVERADRAIDDRLDHPGRSLIRTILEAALLGPEGVKREREE